MREERIIEQISVRRHLHHHGIREEQVFGDPVFQLFVGNLVGTKDGALLGIHTHGYKVG